MIEQAIVGSALAQARIPDTTFARWQAGRSADEITELIASILKFRRFPGRGGVAQPP